MSLHIASSRQLFNLLYGNSRFIFLSAATDAMFIAPHTYIYSVTPFERFPAHPLILVGGEPWSFCAAYYFFQHTRANIQERSS